MLLGCKSLSSCRDAHAILSHITGSEASKFEASHKAVTANRCVSCWDSPFQQHRSLLCKVWILVTTPLSNKDFWLIFVKRPPEPSRLHICKRSE